MNTFYAIDGNNLFHRAAHTNTDMTSSDGTNTGPLTVFCSMIHSIRRDFSPDMIMVAFDTGGRGGRNDLYPEYKAHRADHEEIDAQIPLAIGAVQAMGLSVVTHDDFEADDVIATYVRDAEAAGYSVTIVSSDKDLLQLCSDNVMRLTTGFGANTWYGPEEVTAKYGVPPARMGDLLALMGDKSDNVPGVKGIGPKTAAALLQEYGDLEGVLTAAPSIKQEKRKDNLLNGSGDARLSRQLVELREVPMSHHVEEFADLGYDMDCASEFFDPLEMYSVLTSLEVDLTRSQPS